MSAWAAEAPPGLSAWADERIKTVDGRIEALKARETRAIEALKQSREMLGNDIESLDDKGTALIMAGTMEISLRALDGVRVRVVQEEILKRDIALGAKEGRYMGFAESVGLGVFKKSGEGWQRYDRTMLISGGEELKTATAGYIKMLFSDGAVVDLDEKSRLTIAGASVYDVAEGRAHVMITPPLSGSGVTIDSRGVRFSATSAEFDLDARDSKGVTVIVTDGEVTALTDGKTGPAGVIIKAGEKVFFKDGVVVGPNPLDSEAVVSWW